MTALKPSGSPSPSQNVLGIAHRCLRRKSSRTYELLDPKKPGETISFDVGQVREIVLMDKRLREEDVVTSVPAGYAEFAARFNKYATGPERFATYTFVKQKPVISKEGIPIVWEHFLIDDSLVRSQSDLPSDYRPLHDVSSFDNVSAETAGELTASLSAYMRGASKTTDELTRFWAERGAIEIRYASSLAQLSEKPFGQHEPSEFRKAIDGFRLEVARQAMAHNTLAKQIAVDLEARCLELTLDQSAHLRDVCEPAIRRLQQEETSHDNSPVAGISAEWKKDYRNLRRLLNFRQFDSVRNRRESMPASRRNYFADDSAGRLAPIDSPSRSGEWNELLRSCEDMEANRSQFMKDLLAAYAEILSSIQAADRESYSNIIRTFDLFRAEDVLEDFAKNFVVGGRGILESHSRPPVSFGRSQAIPTQSSSTPPSIDPAVKTQRRSTMSAGLGRFSGPRPRPFSLRPSSRLIDTTTFAKSRPSSIHFATTDSFSQGTHDVDVSRNLDHPRTRPPLPKLQTTNLQEIRRW